MYISTTVIHSPHIYISADLSQSESVLDYIVINQYLAICRLQSAITAIPCNLPFCNLQSTYTAECSFLIAAF